MSIEELSTDDAISALMDVDDDTDESVDDGAEDATDDAMPEESDVDDPATEDAEDDPDEDNDDGEDDGEQDEPETVIDPPQFWDAEGREAFAKLPKDAQELVRRYEEQRISAVGRKMDEIARERKTIQAKRQQLDSVISSAETFQSEIDRKIQVYEGIDWFQAANELDPVEYQKHRANFDALKQSRDKAQKAKELAEKQALELHTEDNLKALKEKAPEFFDASGALSAPVAKDLSGYLLTNGYTPDTLKWASASDLIIARKAMLYDQMQAKAKTAAKPKAQPQQQAPGKKGVKPASPAQPVTSNQKRSKQLQGKASLTMDEAISLML